MKNSGYKIFHRAENIDYPKIFIIFMCLLMKFVICKKIKSSKKWQT